MTDERNRISVPVWLVVAVSAVAALAVGVLATLALTDDDDNAKPAPRSSAELELVPMTTGTSATVTTTTVRDTTTTTTNAAPTTTTSSPPPASGLGDFPTYSATGASGSGCSPGPGALSDGWWFGELPSGTAPIADFDLKCFFFGPAATDAAMEDGYGGPPENDYWVRNDNATLRPVSISAAVEVFCVLRDPDPTVPTRCSRFDLSYFDVWLRVVNGQVDRIVEQFVP